MFLQVSSLTAGADSVTGLAGNDTITGNYGTTPTIGLTSLDAIDGGAGTDTLNIAVTAAINLANAVGATVSNVENLNLTSNGTVTADTKAYAGLTSLSSSSVGNSTFTASATTDVVAGIAAPTGSGAAVIDGGKNVTLSVSDTATTGAASGNTIVIGGTTAPAGAIVVSQNESVTDAANAGIATGSIAITGGTSVTVNSTVTTGAANNAADIATIGTIGVTSKGTLESVTVTQSAETSAFGVTGITAIKTDPGAVTITDLNTATKADSIKSIALTSFGNSTHTGNMLETLTLTGGATTALASGSFGITQSAGLKTAGTIPTTLNVNLNGVVTSLTDTSDQYTAMNIATLAGGAILSLDATKVAELNFTGPKGITIGSVASLVSTAAITSGDGGVTISSQLNANQSFTGGAGKDSISLGATTKAITTGAGDDTVTATASLGTGGSIDAGEGSDTLSMSAADAATVSATAAYEAKISGFEKLSIGSASTTATVNTANLDDINDVKVGGVAAGQTLTVSGLSTGTNLTANAGAVGTIVASLAQPTGTADELNVAVTAKTAQTIGGLTATGYEVINFATSKSTATGAIQHVLSGLTAGDATTINVTGTAGLTLGANFTGTKLTSYDASGVTGTGVVTYTTGALAAAATIKGGAGGDNLNAASAKKAITIHGNAGNDTIVGSTAAANTLEGGAGNDSLTGGGKADTIDGGEGTDTFIMTSSTATGSGSVDGMAINLGDVAIPQSTVYAAVSKFLTSAAPSLAASSATDLFSTESTTNASIVDTLTSIENVTTGTGIDFVVGSAGTNVIITDNAADYVSAGAGDDYIKADVSGNNDVDKVEGGTGNDTFVWSDAGENDLFVETATGGVDTILVNGDLSLVALKTGATVAAAAASSAGAALTNFEQIVIGTGNTATVTGAQLSTLTINISEVAAGTSALVVTATAASTTDLSNLTFNASTYVDATGTMVASNAMTSGTDLITINGGAGAETILAPSYASVISPGAGIDTLTLGAGADQVIVDQVLNANRSDISAFSTSGDKLVLDRSALGLGSADDTIDAGEIDVSAAGTKTAAADIVVLTDGTARTAAQVETLLQGVYTTGGASGAGDIAVIYLSSVTNALVLAYDADVDVGTDGTGMVTVANLVGLVGSDLANITAADFAFIA